MRRHAGARTGWLVLLWTAVALLSAGLMAIRYRDVVNDPTAGMDLSTFLQAAHQVREGGSPYDVAAYVYSPLLAILLAPFAGVAVSTAIPVWTVLVLFASMASIACVLATCWHELPAYGRPVFAGVAAFTFFYSYPALMETWLGQVDVFVLLALALSILATTRGRIAVGGGFVGLAGALKSWPVVALLASFRRGGHGRLRATVGAAVPLVLTVVVSVLVIGPGSIVTWVTRTFSSSNQDLTSYSAWGAGRDLFSASGVMPPFTVSIVLRVVVTALLLGWAVALLMVVLRRPGDMRLAFWNVLSCALFILPVSHIAYRLLALPMLWLWMAMSHRVRRPTWYTVLGVAAVCWFGGYRVWPGDSSVTARLLYLVILLSSYAAVTMSVLTAARLREPIGPTPVRRDEREERVVIPDA